MAASHDTTSGPGAAPIHDQRSTPRGVLPRQLQMWLMIGLAVIILAIILFTGHAAPAPRASAAMRTAEPSLLAPDRIQTALAKAAPTPEFQAALKSPQSPTGNQQANTDFIHGLQQAQAGGGSGAALNPLSDSSFIQQLDPRLAKPFLVGFSQAMDLVFLIGSAVMVVAFIVVWFLPHVELRSGSAYESRGKSDAADAAVAAEAEVAPPGLSH